MFYSAVIVLLLGFSFSAVAQVSTVTAIRMIRSLSGPSGKAVGTKFVLDEIRNRFVYPQDSSLTVSFECEAPKGEYTLTAYWKDPEGRTVGISPDVKIETVNEDLNSYWVFMIGESRPSGIWTVELRINGEPVGSHSFELFVPAPPRPPVAETPAQPSIDDLYNSAVKALVWVHKLDGAGQRIGTSSGFVVAADSVLTAFQSIDSAMKIEIEFADGGRVATDEILACNRLQDWALVKVGTRDVSPFQIGKSDSVGVGEQAIVFSIGPGGFRTIGSVDIIGRGKVPGFGERIHIYPQPPSITIGGPILNLFGKVVGVIGGSMAPGMRLNHPNTSFNPTATDPRSALISATPVDGTILQKKHLAVTLQDLLGSGILTPPLSNVPVFHSGTITDEVPTNYSFTSRTQFSRESPEIIVYSIWKGIEKKEEGVVSMNIFDANNKVRSRFDPQPLKLKRDNRMQCQFIFSPRKLEPGFYRIDLYWNGLPVWRTSMSISD